MKKCLFIFLIAFLLRLLIIFVWYQSGNGSHLGSDASGYYAIGKNLVGGGGFESYVIDRYVIRRPPIYPLFIALTLKLNAFPLGIYAAQALIGALNVVIVFFLGKLIFNEKVGWIASIILGFDYLSIRQTVSVMPEILFLFFMLLAFYCLVKAVKEKKKGLFFAGGLFAGFSLLTKDVLVLYLPVLALWLLWQNDLLKFRILNVALFLTGLFLTVGPWSIRASLAHDRLIFITVGAAHTFYLANNPQATGGTTGGDWEFVKDTDYPVDPALPPLFTVEADRFLMQKSLEFIRTQPSRFFELMVIKIVNMWRPYQTDSPPLAQWLMAMGYIPVLIFGLTGLFLNAKRALELFPLYSLLLYFFVIHAILIAHIRYRYPAMPFLMIFAAYGMVELWHRIQTTRSSSQGCAVLQKGE